jgi:hypothetical protein
VTGHLILIASYPKSGNTWVRLFFENLLRAGPTAVSINDIGNPVYGSERRWLFDSHAPVDAADLLPDEVEDLLPDLYAQVAIEAKGPVFMKVHDRARRTPPGQWLFPPEHVKAVLYLVRHPFDVAVSYAHHRDIPVDDAVADLCDDDHVIAGIEGSLPLPLAELPGSWSGNVASWLDEGPYPVTLVRYEDLYSNPFASFARLAAAAGLAAPDEAMARALETTRFDRLKAEEAECGFRERPHSSPAFFRSGRPQSWVGMLSDDLRRQLVAGCGSAMERLGYQGDGTVAPLVPYLSVQ